VHEISRSLAASEVSSRTGIVLERKNPPTMKVLLEILVSVILHPVALILMLLNIIGRSDLDGGKKVVWALVGIIWGIGPILYITVGEGTLW